MRLHVDLRRVASAICSV
ncbi:putative leader peptide [Streptomyces sp. NPDC055506]